MADSTASAFISHAEKIGTDTATMPPQGLK